jgi:hypothetical protein
MLFNIDVIFTHFILLFSRFKVTVAYGLIKFCKKRGARLTAQVGAASRWRVV